MNTTLDIDAFLIDFRDENLKRKFENVVAKSHPRTQNLCIFAIRRAAKSQYGLIWLIWLNGDPIG